MTNPNIQILSNRGFICKFGLVHFVLYLVQRKREKICQMLLPKVLGIAASHFQVNYCFFIIPKPRTLDNSIKIMVTIAISTHRVILYQFHSVVVDRILDFSNLPVLQPQLTKKYVTESSSACPILVRSIISTFINGFQNDFSHLFSLTITSVMRKVCFDTPKVKVTVEGQIFELTLSLFINGFLKFLHACSP